MNLCNLRELRKERGLTQVQLAEMMSVTQGAVSGWESGTALPQASQLPPPGGSAWLQHRRPVRPAVHCLILRSKSDSKEADDPL